MSLWLFPGLGQLLTPVQLLDLIQPVCAVFRLNAQLSQIELTADFDLPEHDLGRLNSWLRVRYGGGLWTRGSVRKTSYWGKRRSARQTKQYFKVEAGPAVIRLEHTFRRNFLWRKGVNDLQDLLRVDWADVARRRAEWVELDLAGIKRVKPADVALWFRLLDEGLESVLGTLPPNQRRRVLERLKPLPIQMNLEAAFAHLTVSSAVAIPA